MRFQVTSSAKCSQVFEGVRSAPFYGLDVVSFKPARTPPAAHGRTAPAVTVQHDTADPLPFAPVMVVAQICTSRTPPVVVGCRAYAPATRVKAAATSSRAVLLEPLSTIRTDP